MTGGIGLSDLFYRHFEWFTGDFSVLTFDYQIQFADNGEFADAVAELLHRLKEKAWLVGQSLGGCVGGLWGTETVESYDGLAGMFGIGESDGSDWCHFIIYFLSGAGKRQNS